MQKLAEICVRRPVFATMLIMALVVLGIFSYNRLTVERFPRVELPTIIVTTRLTGAAPQEIETEITDKVEQSLNTIAGIDELRSVSTEGVSQVVITFDLDRGLDSAAQDVRDKVNTAIPLLPQNIDQPTVEKLDPDASPIMTISIASNRSVREMTEYADKVLRRQLESVSGVGQILIIGGRKRQINLLLDADKLRAYNLTGLPGEPRAPEPESRTARAVELSRKTARSRFARSDDCNSRRTSIRSWSRIVTDIRSNSRTSVTPRTELRASSVRDASMTNPPYSCKCGVNPGPIRWRLLMPLRSG
jgi:hypothetical protein